MKKILIIFTCVCIVINLLSGCQKVETEQMETKEIKGMEESSTSARDEEQVTKLIWQSGQGFKEHEAYFNQVLRQKGLPFEVEFIDSDTAQNEQKVDLREVSWTWMEPYDITEDMLEGRFLDLDEYLDSEEGKVIKDSLPQNVWDTYKLDGKQYTVLSVGFIPAKIVYIWDTELAKKYDVHPENWDGNIWEHAGELSKVCEGEKGTNSFVTVEGLRLYSQYLEGMTQPLGIYYPFVIRETDDFPSAELLYETPEYQEYLAGVQELYEKGIYDPDVEENPEQSVKSFLKIDADFKTKDAYAAWQEDGFWDTHEVKEVWQQPLWRLSTCAFETGITAGSEHPGEAFSLLCGLYEDPDLVNALMWGEEGKNYEVCGNTAEKPVTGGYIPALYVGNNFLAYAEVGQDENKKELYPKWLKECEKSKINGFEFSGRGCETELQNLCQVCSDWDARSGKDILTKNQDRIQECRDAGADRVAEEWNRQYQEWRAKQG